MMHSPIRSCSIYYGNVCGSTIQDYYASYWSIPILKQFGIHIMMKIKNNWTRDIKITTEWD